MLRHLDNSISLCFLSSNITVAVNEQKRRGKKRSNSLRRQIKTPTIPCLPTPVSAGGKQPQAEQRFTLRAREGGRVSAGRPHFIRQSVVMGSEALEAAVTHRGSRCRWGTTGVCVSAAQEWISWAEDLRDAPLILPARVNAIKNKKRGR